MAFRTNLLVLLSRILCFAAATSALTIYSGHSASGQIRMRAFSYLIYTLIIQATACALELFGQLLNMWFGSTTPVPDRVVLCFFVILVEWMQAFLMVGTACSALSALTFFMANDSFTTDVNVRAMLHCMLSLLAAACSVLTAYLTVKIAHSRPRQPQE